MEVSKPEWTLGSEQRLQEELVDLQEFLRVNYSYDSSNLSVEVNSLEVSKRRCGADCREEIVIKDGDARLVILELEDLEELESNRGFVIFLEMVAEGRYMSIGTVMKLNRLELAEGLEDSEIIALTVVMVTFLMSFAELIVTEETYMNAQPACLLETWNRLYMFYPEKLVEYEGVRYLRSDHPASNHH